MTLIAPLQSLFMPFRRTTRFCRRRLAQSGDRDSLNNVIGAARVLVEQSPGPQLSEGETVLDVADFLQRMPPADFIDFARLKFKLTDLHKSVQMRNFIDKALVEYNRAELPVRLDVRAAVLRDPVGDARLQELRIR